MNASFVFAVLFVTVASAFSAAPRGDDDEDGNGGKFMKYMKSYHGNKDWQKGGHSYGDRDDEAWNSLLFKKMFNRQWGADHDDDDRKRFLAEKMYSKRHGGGDWEDNDDDDDWKRSLAEKIYNKRHGGSDWKHDDYYDVDDRKNFFLKKMYHKYRGGKYSGWHDQDGDDDDWMKKKMFYKNLGGDYGDSECSLLKRLYQKYHGGGDSSVDDDDHGWMSPFHKMMYQKKYGSGWNRHGGDYDRDGHYETRRDKWDWDSSDDDEDMKYKLMWILKMMWKLMSEKSDWYPAMKDYGGKLSGGGMPIWKRGGN